MERQKAIALFEQARRQAAIHSKDPQTKVCCLIVSAKKGHEILSVGYNELPRGLAALPERWERPAKYKYVEHAERNALFAACKYGIPMFGAIAVSSLFPCVECSRALIQSGIRTLISEVPDEQHERWGADFTIALEILHEAGVELILGGLPVSPPSKS